MNIDKASSKNRLLNTFPSKILIISLLSIFMCAADLLAHFIDGNYSRLVFSFVFSTCLLLIPLVLFCKNLRLYAWLLLPFVVLVPISLFCVLLYHMPFNYDMMVVVYNTNVGEAYEFANGYVIYFVLAIAAYIFLYISLIRLLPKQIPFKTSTLLSVGGILTLGLLSFVHKEFNTYPGKVKESITESYFGGLIYSASTLNKSIQIARNHDELVKGFKFNARQKAQVTERQIYVLVLGESSRVKNWQIYGYKRATSPCLAKTKSLIKFANTCSGGYITNVSVPLYLTRATPDNYEQHYREKSIVSAFKEAGFRTYWLSNQNNFQDVSMLTKEADEKVYLPSDYTFGKNVDMDMKLLPALKNVLARNEKKTFIVLHTLGSHYDYAARYPDEYNIFRPSTKTEKANPTDYSKREYIINSYDNTIRYTDALISKVIDMVQQTNATSTVSYISDHGEDMFDDERKLSQHIHPVPSQYIAHVPFFMWVSPKYNSAFPDKVANLESHANSPIGSQNIFYSLMDMGNVAFTEMDSTKSIASGSFKGGVQRILGGGGKVYNFSQLK